jgi:hypothetical protein
LVIYIKKNITKRSEEKSSPKRIKSWAFYTQKYKVQFLQDVKRLAEGENFKVVKKVSKG